MKILFVIIMLCTGISLTGQIGNLKDLRWEKRILVVDGVDSIRSKQVSVFQDQQKECNDRRLLVLIPQDNTTLISINELPRRQYSFSKKIYRKVDREKNLNVVLLGLDGGVKYSSTTLVMPQTIFDLIDSMPMRKNEIRYRKQ
ncbi:MAG: DUF4174 domain-containing protein [Bacteroidota bacterium]